MSRLYDLALVIVFGIIAALSPLTAALAAPNIVIFIADDMGWGDVGFHQSEIRTPELDRLAADGVTLNRFYVQSVCSPTRATLMTGRSPMTTGVSSPFNPWYSRGLAVDEKLLPEYLREAGYQTHAVGKWHLGPNEMQYHPLNRGFDSYYGNLHGYMNYYTRTAFGRLDWQRNGETVYEEGYSTHLLGEEAARVVRERDPDRPLFLYVTFNAPHSPLQAPQESISEYAGIADEHRRIYAAMVTEMDRAIARVTTALEDEQITDNTLLMFFSDNGGVPALGASNAPLRGGKNSPWEGGLRVPALVSWPEELEPDTVFDQRITVMDLLPTFLAAADIELQAPKPIEGQNLWPALADGVPIASQNVILTNYLGGDTFHAYFKNQWKLVRGNNENGELQNYLFEILEDPYEQNDLAEQYPDVLNRLVAELDAMPRVEALTADQRSPDFSAPGAPYAPIPDDRPPGATAYAESGPVPYPPGNYAEESVRENVNERFLSEALDTEQSAAGFESDTREVFLRRGDVIAALEITPGMAVADVGAGSGFYIELMAEAVGSGGRVYAVEIAPNWIEYLEQKVEQENLSQVSVVRGTGTSVELAPGSVDLIFSSDTYHHFEFPQTSLAGIYEALRPGGRWVVLDYDRIEGVTPPGRMDHLRLGRTEAIEEITAAGFVLEQEPDLDLKDNYLAIFRRP